MPMIPFASFLGDNPIKWYTDSLVHHNVFRRQGWDERLIVV